MSYSDQLKDARWQKRRLEVMQRDKFLCRICPTPEEGAFLNVHHLVYYPGRYAWEYDDTELLTLCAPCHDKLHTPPVLHAPEPLSCHWCKALLTPSDVAGRIGKHEPLCEPCAALAEHQR